MQIQWRPASPGNFLQGRQGKQVDRVVIHVTDGTLRGSAAWFADPKSNVSAHFIVGMDGTVIQCVSVENAAYHAGDWGMNLRSIGIEHEGQPSKGPWTPSEAQLEASADLVAELCRRFNIPPHRAHIIAHSEVNPNRAARHNCPGPTWPWGKYVEEVQARLKPAAPQPAHKPDVEDRRPVRLFDAQTNTEIGSGVLINGTNKVYLTSATLAALRRK